MSLDISVNSSDYLPQFYSNIFTQSFDSFKISYIFLFGIVVLVYIMIFALYGNSTGPNSSLMIIIEIILWVVLIIVIGVNINNNEYNFSTQIKNLFSNQTTQLDVNVTAGTPGTAAVTPGTPGTAAVTPGTTDISGGRSQITLWTQIKNFFSSNNSCETSESGEVFHIPNNLHTYEQARSICSKFNSRLATYKEVEDAYINGANWCSYGWSEDQLALFPTQFDVYNNLKRIPGHEHDCGRPGVNGGFIDNTNVRFGINCYGKKPEQTEQDKAYSERLKMSYSPIVDESVLDQINKDKLDILVSPFNKDKWSIQ